MNCPFCQCANAATARACRVCGGPLGAEKPEIAPVAVAAPVVVPAVMPAVIPVVMPAPATTEIGRRTFAENAGELVSACFCPDEDPLVWLVRSNGLVQFWDARDGGSWAFSLRRLFRKTRPLCCALSARDFIATGHDNGEVRWHNLNGRARKKLAAHVGRVLALAANETHFYSGGSDGVIWSTELNKKAKSRALIEGLGAMTTFAAAPDANFIAVGCDDGAVCLWRFSAEKAAFQLDWTRRGHGAPIESLAFSANGQMIVSRDKSGALGLWAAQTSYQLPLPIAAQCSHIAPAWASDNRLLALVDKRNVVAVFDVALGVLERELPPFDEPITHLAFAAGAPWLLAASGREIAVWKFASDSSTR